MLLLVPVALAAQSVHAQPAARPAPCLPPAIVQVQNVGHGPGFKRLGDLPPANHYLAVDRRVGGCPVPAMVRTGIGR